MENKNLFSLIAQANSMRFKLLAIVGQDDNKKDKLINILKKDGWTLIDVESELVNLRQKIETNNPDDDIDIELSSKIKEWFNSKPDKIILVNASILYHKTFMKTSPIGAFKYNSRNKSCVLFLEDEKLIGHRLYFGEYGSEDYKDQEIYDILIENIDNIDDNSRKVGEQYTDNKAISTDDPIKNYIQFYEIKDVVDIDSDLKEFDNKRYIVESFIISDSLEEQIMFFFDDLEKPTHKSRNIIGNYGSGKSHLIAFLVALIQEPSLCEYVRNERIKERLKKFHRKFFTVHFELQANQTELRRWFFEKVRKQLNEKYNIGIPKFDLKNQFDDKENIHEIMRLIKERDDKAGLFVVMDEVSDFLLAKPKEYLRQDLQFWRVVGQTTQSEDMMFVCSMQEDIFSSPKFKDVADEISRARERYQNIIIHKEDVEKVISERIVPKTEEQKLKLEEKFKPYIEKIKDVSQNIDNYISLFPLTPFLIDMFNTLPYFEKRGVIQFSMEEIKKNLYKPFPFFLTFEKIYDILANDPNRKNIPEVYNVVKTMDILSQKIELLDKKYKEDALKIVKGLAVLFLRDETSKGVVSQEIANSLLIIPENSIFNADDYVELLVKKIREVTDGEYIKIDKDKNNGVTYIKFDTKRGVDPEEKIAQKVDSISNDDIEDELFKLLERYLEIRAEMPNIYEDECAWKSKKSFRKGKIVFQKKHNTIEEYFDNADYVVVFVSPNYNDQVKKLHDVQLNIKLVLKSEESVIQLKEIVAIKRLREMGFEKSIMERKLKERLEGYSIGSNNITGFNYRFLQQFKNFSKIEFNGDTYDAKKFIDMDKNRSISELFEELKSEAFDSIFNKKYPLHPKYSEQFSSVSIYRRMDAFWSELIKNEFLNLSYASKNFLKSIQAIDHEDYPSCINNPICDQVINILKKNSDRVTDIQKDIVDYFAKSQFGLEKEIVYFMLSLMTWLGKTTLKQHGGREINISNVSSDLKSISAFDSIKYVTLHKMQSLDFAVGLLNVFGLKGEMVRSESDRMSIFRDYKDRVAETLKKLEDIEKRIEDINRETKVYLNKEKLKELVDEINIISWKEFDIKNVNAFSSLQKYHGSLSDIKDNLLKIDNLYKALTEYNDIKDKIIYMERALELIDSNSILQTHKAKIKELKNIYSEVGQICKDINSFVEPQNRVRINGMFEIFQDKYIKDIYYTEHERYVGSKVNWDILDDIFESDTYKALLQFSKISKQINDLEFKKLRNKVDELKRKRCNNKNLIYELKKSVKCEECSFPNGYNYSRMVSEINNIEDKFEELLKNYEAALISGIREYSDNIQFLEDEEDKKFIQNILEKKSLENKILSDKKIRAINELFKEVEILSIKKDDILQKIFPKSEMVSIDTIKNNFERWLENILAGKKEEQIRLKLEEDSEKD